MMNETTQKKKLISNKNLGILLGALVSIGILAVLAFSLDYSLFIADLKKTNLFYILIFCFFHALSYLARAFRWRYLLPNSAQYRTSSLFKATVVGALGTFVLPLRAGEFVRAWMLGRSEKVSVTAAFASVVTERVFDVLMLLVMLALCIAKNPNLPTWVSIAGWSLSAIAGVIILLMCAAYLWSDWVLRIGTSIIDFFFKQKRPPFINTLLEMFEEFLRGLRAINSFTELFLTFFWSAFIWFLYTLMYQIGMHAFGAESTIWLAMLINVMIALAVAAPSSPGFLGTFELGCVASLAIYGFSTEFATAYALVLHGASALVVFALGGFILWQEKLGFKDLSRRG